MNLEQKLEQLSLLCKKHLPNHKLEIPATQLDTSHYRLRAEFGIFHNNQEQYSLHHITYDAKTKQRLFWENGFPLASHYINSLLKLVEEFFASREQQAYKLFQAEYLTTMSGQAIISLLYHRKLTQEEALTIGNELQNFICQRLNKGLADLSVIIRAKRFNAVVGQNFIKEEFNINGSTHSLYQVENSFSQPNGKINEKMLEFVNSNVHTDKDILELYCGVGNFTIVLSKSGRKVVATEVNKQAVEFLKKNLELNNITNVEVGRVSAEEFTQAMNKERPFKRLAHLDLDSYDFEVVFVDPPRSGLDAESLKMISVYPKIVYVSCNPETLMPNIAELIENYGYKLDKLEAFDQFPQTPHIEAIALLSKIS